MSTQNQALCKHIDLEVLKLSLRGSEKWTDNFITFNLWKLVLAQHNSKEKQEGELGKTSQGMRLRLLLF